MKSLVLILCLMGMASADDEREGKYYKGSGLSFLSRKQIEQTNMNANFKNECGSCHMIYLPGLLPARSWTKMMNNLENHFGEDASLDEATKKDILDYLVKNSSDNAYSRRGKKILATIGANDAPLRISETAYFNRKHDEINASVYKRKAIGSKANCLACHPGAETGNFSEHDVRIPKANELPMKKKK